MLLVSDAYPYAHEHEAGQCGMTAEEMPKAVRPEDTDVVIERALSWTRYVDAEVEPLALAPIHGRPAAGRTVVASMLNRYRDAIFGSGLA